MRQRLLLDGIDWPGMEHLLHRNDEIDGNYSGFYSLCCRNWNGLTGKPTANDKAR